MSALKQSNRRRQKAIQNSYDAGGNGRRLKGWNPTTAGPNKSIVGFEKIRARSQDAVRNDWSGESSIQKWTTSLVGCGIVPRWEDEAIGKLWERWAPDADSYGVLDIYGMQALAVRSWLASGEIFARRRPRAAWKGYAVPLQIQLIESEYCPLLDADTYAGLPEGNRIRSGIELNRYDERTAYWMYRDHPGEGATRAAMTAELLVRVPASEIIHVYDPKRAGQLRGVSSMAAVLTRLRSTGDFEDAVLDRQKLANLFTLFITKGLPDSWDDLDIDPTTGLPAFYGDDGNPIAGLEPGMSHELKPGEKVEFSNPPEAGVTFSDYLRTTGLGTAAGQGLPYELYSGDIQNVSDRTLRVVINEFRRFAEQRQWHIIIPQFCRKVVQWFAGAAVLGGQLPLSKLEAARTPEHIPHGWDYIHPVQDVEGKIKAIEAGLTSRDREINKRGDDPKKIDAERKAAQDRADKLGLTPPEPAPGPGRPAAAPGAPAPAPAPAANAELAQMLQLMTQMMASMQSVVVAMGQVQNSGAGGGPLPVIHNHLPAPIVNVAPAVNVEPARAVVAVAAPIVNVPAPVVNVQNNVQPADVNVNLPTRVTETDITRDFNGDIAKVKQTEKTLQ